MQNNLKKKDFCRKILNRTIYTFSCIYLTITFRDSRWFHSCSRTSCFHMTFVFWYVRYCSDNSHSNKKFKPANILLLEVANSDRVIFLSHKRLPSPPRQEKSNSHWNVHLYSAKCSSIEKKEIKLHHNKHTTSKYAITILSTHHYLEIGCLKIYFT